MTPAPAAQPPPPVPWGLPLLAAAVCFLGPMLGFILFLTQLEKEPESEWADTSALSSLYDRVIILCGAAKEALHSTTLGACLSAGACAALALLLASRAQPTPQKAASRRRKLAREIAEYKRIRQIRAGVPARQSQAITNKVDPIGVRRQRLLGLDNFGNPVAVPPASPVVSTP